MALNMLLDELNLMQISLSSTHSQTNVSQYTIPVTVGSRRCLIGPVVLALKRMTLRLGSNDLFFYHLLPNIVFSLLGYTLEDLRVWSLFLFATMLHNQQVKFLHEILPSDRKNPKFLTLRSLEKPIHFININDMLSHWHLIRDISPLPHVILCHYHVSLTKRGNLLHKRLYPHAMCNNQQCNVPLSHWGASLVCHIYQTTHISMSSRVHLVLGTE